MEFKLNCHVYDLLGCIRDYNEQFQTYIRSFNGYILLGILIPPSSRMTTPFSIEFSMPSLTIFANSSGFPGLRGNSITK